MSSSFHGTSMTSSVHAESHNNSSQLLEMTKSLIENFTSESLMTQSLDPTILSVSSSMNTSISSIKDLHPPSTTNNGNLYNDQSNIPIVHSTGPLVTASKMMPVPESLMSPDCACAPIIMQQQILQRPISALTTSTSNYITSTSQSRSIKVKDQRPSSSPASSKSPRAVKKPEKSSPSNSPRKAIVNTTNARIHQSQSLMKQVQQHHIHPNESTTAVSSISSVATTEDEDEDDIDRVNVEKLTSIKRAAQKNFKQTENTRHLLENKEAEKSAILIQKLWRGYSTRKQTVKNIAEALQQKRTQEYVVKLTKDMEMTKQALENERKIQQLQMQAINALWKKVSNMQHAPETGAAENGATSLGSDSANIVQDLTKTCSLLTNQVQQLQLSMRDILNCMTVFAQLPQMQQSTSSSMSSSQFKDSSETQTEIVAVHTPQIEHPKDFPFIHKIQRPSSLPINSSSNDSNPSTKSNTVTTTDDHELDTTNGGDHVGHVIIIDEISGCH